VIEICPLVVIVTVLFTPSREMRAKWKASTLSTSARSPTTSSRGTGSSNNDAEEEEGAIELGAPVKSGTALLDTDEQYNVSAVKIASDGDEQMRSEQYL
jgi:hypothetical protein